MHSHQPRVIVIGAGIAGLEAARQLENQGCQVTIFEKESRPGGRIRTETHDDMYYDVGAQILANFYTNTLRVIAEVGLQHDVLPITGSNAILRAGKLHVLEPSLAMLASRVISTRSKTRFFRVIRDALANWQNLDFHAFYKAAQLDDSSLAAYVTKELGEESLEYLFQPPLAGLFYWTPEHISKAFLFVMLRAALGMKVMTLRNGLGQLPLAISALLKDVRLKAEVVQVRQQFPQSHYTVTARLNEVEEVFAADGIVCAVPAPLVAPLFPQLTAEQREFFTAIPYSSTVTTALGLAHPLGLQIYSFFTARKELDTLAAVVIQSSKHRNFKIGQGDVVSLFASGLAGQQLLHENDQTITAALVDDIMRTPLRSDIVNNTLTFTSVNRWDYSIPLFDVGHFHRLVAFAAGSIETDRIVFAGDYLAGPFVELALTSGAQAAARLREKLTWDVNG